MSQVIQFHTSLSTNSNPKSFVKIQAVNELWNVQAM